MRYLKVLGLCALAGCASLPRVPAARPPAQSYQAEIAQILAERAASNAAIARRDAAGHVANMLPGYRGTWARSLQHRSRDSVFAGLARQLVDTAMLGYVRTPGVIELSEDGTAAAEYGRWVGRWRRPDGVQLTSGSYYATWQRTAEGWRLNSEAFVAIECTGSSRCPLARVATNAVAPDTVEFASGALRLRGLVYRPVGAGRHPAVLFLHGSGDNYDPQAAAVGPLYTAHGYVLFMPFRRGQGLSAGRGETIVARLNRESAANGAEARGRLMTQLLETEQLDDVRAALSYLRTRPDVDGDRVAVAGNSFGGILSVFAAAWVPGIRAAIASAPAAQSWAGAPTLRERLLVAAREARVSIFFFQAENDYNLAPTSDLPAAMKAAGRPHIVRTYPAFGATVEDRKSVV